MSDDRIVDEQLEATDAPLAERLSWLIADEFAAARQEGAQVGTTGFAGTGTRHTMRLPDGGELSLLRWGSGAPRVIFLHGGGLNAHAWDSVIVRLGVDCVAIDLPGHGDSSWRDAFDYHPEVLAEVLVPVLHELVSTPIVLVGQSLGGLTGVVLAALNPELVSRLVIVDITPGRTSGMRASTSIREFMTAKSDFGSYDEVVEHALAVGMGRNRESLERGVILNTRVRPDGRIVFKHHFASRPPVGEPAREDLTYLWPVLQQIDERRVLLVRGTTGIVSDEQADEFRARMPEAEVTDLVAGHNVQRDAPDDLAREITRFALS
jgi:pimeloyl-ACP methyl ester carboxylesterase